MDIKVGQTLYLKPVNNAARYSKEILETKVIKVGRKYFEVDRGIVKKYRLDNLQAVTEYAPDYEIHFSKQEILDEWEYEKLYSDIKMKFNAWNNKNFTLDQLRRIKKIILETK